MSYDVRIMWTRGEVEFMDLTPFCTQGDWTRKLDTWDEAHVTTGPMSAACCAQLVSVRPWLHELWIRQDGETQFIGPIQRPAPGTTGQIDALGLAAWLSVRFIRQSFDTTATPVPVSQMVHDIIISALSASDPNIATFLNVMQCNTPMSRVIDATGGGGQDSGSSNGPPIAWDDELSDMIGTYMHMSSFGRELTFWCAKQACLHELARFGPNDLYSDGPVSFDGDTYATRVAVYNDKTGVESVVGFSGGLDPTYGILVERKFEDASVTSAITASDGAKTHVSKNGLPKLIAGDNLDQGLSLKLRACDGLASSKLQVGSCMPVTLANACSPLTAFMRIEEVHGTWGASGEETSITLVEQDNASIA